MKKGLRPSVGGGFWFGFGFESRPYEEGIKTITIILFSMASSCLNRDLMKKGLRHCLCNGTAVAPGV